MERYICIHGHFYQPPRENPWLEAIEVQDTAYPYHDWNARITAECYEPNAASRILDGEGRIRQIVNNYSRISFNFGPTLLSWLERALPVVYAAILEADQESRTRFSGHGSALAQAYNHMIMPLANRRDKITQVRWGLRDFERRFGRKPEGMWLPETAVDLETLDILAENGIRFTILSPYQAVKVRKYGGRKWHDVTGGTIDPTTPYEQRLPSGRRMALFFYDGPVSRAIAFEGLLTRGENLANRLVGAFSDSRTWPQIVHIATDGESYGHHHRHGDMALAYALHHIESNQLARLTNYGEYLSRHARMPNVQIVENTAWSCMHGLGRWNANCGCNSGRQGWNQEWRGPLREALDWLRDTVASHYAPKAIEWLTDPWAARDDYISVVLDRSPDNLARFFNRHGRRALEPRETITALKLLELQRHAMLMYTSCGWFFDELSGIETVQIIQYAGRVVQLAGELFAQSFEDEFCRRLERAKSNLPEHGDGGAIYRKHVKPAMVDMTKVAAHYAASSLFEDYQDQTQIYCYEIGRRQYERLPSGPAKMAIGHCHVTSSITQESADLSFACVHLGDHNLVGGVRPFAGDETFRGVADELREAFGKVDFPEMVRRLDRHFGAAPFSLSTLFREEQRTILNIILQESLERAEGVYRHQYEHQMLLAKFLGELGIPIPAAFRMTAELVLNADLVKALSQPTWDAARIGHLLDQARTWQVQLDKAGLSYLAEQGLELLAAGVLGEPENEVRLDQVITAVSVARSLPFEVDLFRAQNAVFELLHPATTSAAHAASTSRLEKLKALARDLSIRVE